MTVFENVSKDAVQKLVKKGFTKIESKSIYEQARLQQGEITLIIYTSGKLLIQGNKSKVAQTTELLIKLGIGDVVKSEAFRKEKGWFIGSDESLKGDTFGGLVVAAVKADESLRQKLIELGAADSKTLEDKEILSLAAKIKELVPCEIRSVLPQEYNHHKESVTKLLDKLHRECAHFLQPGIHVVDKYPGCAVGDIMEEKAESKYVEVAAASILARAAALKQLDYLSVQAGFTLPKGSTHVRLALRELQERGLDFRNFVKLHFENVKEFLA